MSRIIDLRYFRATEFGDWWDSMSLRLLFGLDAFRYHWGKSCRISPVPGALGRNLGHDGRSQHNVDRYHEVRAADIFPADMRTRVDAERAIECAIASGMTGIGIYPHWSPHPGLHLDVRVDELPGAPALWGGIDRDGQQQYVAHTEALRLFPERSD